MFKIGPRHGGLRFLTLNPKLTLHPPEQKLWSQGLVFLFFFGGGEGG